jgi:hypothetical protein
VNVFKTKIQRRIPITAESEAGLRAWLIYYEEQIGRPLTGEDYLFPLCRTGLLQAELESWISRPTGRQARGPGP